LPRQNRVTPFGDIVATPERGTFMGNRGALHSAEGQLERAWRVRRWLVCVLEFRGRKRAVMAPGRYTELFFLDEATALAAGHRPCAECRHRRFHDFCAAWAAGLGRPAGSGRPTADEIDNVLHVERLMADGGKRSFPAPLDELPDGTLVVVDGWGERPYLLRGDRLLDWSPGGYRQRLARPAGVTVRVLTPRTAVAAIRAGYAPEIHVSGDSPGG
jgi:hypothetical protein